MKVKDFPILRQKVLDMLPIMQADLSKKLDLDRRDVSRLVGKILEEKIIKRTKSNGTFLIEKSEKDNKKEDKKNFSVLIGSNGKFSPCCGCTIKCVPTNCKLLNEWLL